MTASPPPAHPKARVDVVFRQLDDEWVLYDPQTNMLHAMNLTAAVVWTHCDGARAADDIAAEVRDAFEVPPEPDTVTTDVAETLARFHTEGLLE